MKFIRGERGERAPWALAHEIEQRAPMCSVLPEKIRFLLEKRKVVGNVEGEIEIYLLNYSFLECDIFIF